ncbi:MAG: CRTAC1 family protein [Acidimicrobiia bacterium]|nr:CRTAC1 family protein [Acidimicrobiia bacterium]
MIPAKAGTTNVADSLNQAFLNTLLVMNIDMKNRSIRSKPPAEGSHHFSAQLAGAAGRVGLAVLLSLVLLEGSESGWLAATQPEKPVSVRFEDVTEKAGIRFRHFNAASPKKYILETMGSGCAWIDFDQDGWLDAFYVNGGMTPGVNLSEPPAHALFRNLGNGSFEEVTKAAKVRGDGAFGMGAAVGDYNNDGYPDLFLSGYPHSLLYRNDGNGMFTEASEKAGLRHSGRLASSAGWFDYDRDGNLDLLVLNYLDWSFEKETYCGRREPGYRAYCDPKNYSGISPTLYRNKGDGTFVEATRETKIENREGKGLGLVLADFDHDGWTDVFIANDGVRNFYYRNSGNGTFEDLTYESGAGFSDDGKSEAGMGTDASDYNRDGLLDLHVTHLNHELNRLYRNLGSNQFEDATVKAGLGQGLSLFSGFGTRFADLDRDSWPDLIVINGHILDNIHLYHPQVSHAEEGQVHHNANGKFVNITHQVGGAISNRRVGRGLALGDYDNDGDLDLLISNNGEKGELLRNDSAGNHWLGLKLVGTRSNRDAVGARVRVSFGSNQTTDQIKGGTSYLSSGELRLFFGLGSATRVSQIDIEWPSGTKQTVADLPADSFHEIVEPVDSKP